MKSTELKVAEAIQEDANKGIVRVDSQSILKIGLNPGDLVEIKGNRATVSIVESGYPGDLGMDIIRMDGITRRNAETGIGETVCMKKADFKEAEKIAIAPAREGIFVKAHQDMLKQGLLGKAVVKGDIITMTGTETTSKVPFFEDIFSMLDERLGNFGFGDIKFIVNSTLPQGIVKATDKTQIILEKGKKRKSRMPLKYSRSKKTLTIRKNILAKALKVKPEDIKEVVLI